MSKMVWYNLKEDYNVLLQILYDYLDTCTLPYICVTHRYKYQVILYAVFPKLEQRSFMIFDYLPMVTYQDYEIP